MSLLKVSGLGKSFGGVRAVDGVNFELAPGELLALIGPNGAGKSTTFNMVNGQLRADAGSILLDGHELIGKTPREIWRLGVSRTFQIVETFASLTVVENVQMALLSADRKLFSMWRLASHLQVFHHGEVGENAPVFRHKAHAQPRRLVRFGTRHVMAHETNVAAALFEHADDGLDGGGLASAIATHQGHHFAASDLQAHVVNNLRGAIPGAQFADLQEGVVSGLHQTAFSNVLPLPK